MSNTPKLRQFMLGNLAIHLSKRRLARTRSEVENGHGVLLTTRVDSIRLDSTHILEGRTDLREGRPQEPKLKSSINAQYGLQNVDESTRPLCLQFDPSDQRSGQETKS